MAQAQVEVCRGQPAGDCTKMQEPFLDATFRVNGRRAASLRFGGEDNTFTYQLSKQRSRRVNLDDVIGVTEHEQPDKRLRVTLHQYLRRPATGCLGCGSREHGTLTAATYKPLRFDFSSNDEKGSFVDMVQSYIKPPGTCLPHESL